MSYHTQVYRFVVDSHRAPAKQRNTKGTYLVAASSEKKAQHMLRDCIGFGSIQCIGIVSLPADIIPKHPDSTESLWYKLQILAARLRKNDIFRVEFTNDIPRLTEPKHACAAR